MVKAHSLLYAIYVCLIVSILCGALLYFASLYNQLNIYYHLQEELYIQNQSIVNFALGNKTIHTAIEKEENSNIEGHYETKPYGLFSLVLAKSYLTNDTVTSVHFTGAYSLDKTAVFLTNLSKPLSYSGKVKLVGNSQLPSTFLETSYLSSTLNDLVIDGKNTISEVQLPAINPTFQKIFRKIPSEKTKLTDIEKVKDSLYYNSFFNETKEVYVKSTLENIILKGNFILRSEDSIRVKKNTVLEDVILMAPNITFEEGFRGTVQAFATKRIELEKNVVLNYPSVICVYNNSADECEIKIKKECQIAGAIVLFGSLEEMIDKNTIEIEEGGLLIGDLYCSGKLMLKSNVYGAVYTNRFFLKTGSSSYDNMISGIEINATKRPEYFISVPLFDTQKTTYGILKRYFNIRANSILESVIALTIISVCLYFSVTIFASVYTPKTSMKFYNTQNKANEFFFLEEIENDTLYNKRENENFSIEKEIINDNLKKILITYKDSTSFTFKKSFYVQNNSQ